MIRSIIILFAFATSVFSACVAVGPSSAGTGDGSSWTNRRNNLPTTLVRGNTYYLMDGSYGSYSMTTANSGTTTVTIKKAQSYDFGRSSDGCSNDISSGWNAATMGSSQAVFSDLSTTTRTVGYIIWDGNGQSQFSCGSSSVANGVPSDCGIKLSTTSASDTGGLDLGSFNNFSTPSLNWTFKYMEWQGSGDSNTVEQNGIWCKDGCNNLVLDHVYWHDAGTDFIKLPFSTGATFSYSHFKQNRSTASFHGQMYMSEAGASNVNFYSDVIQDIQGTAIWTFNTGGEPNNFNVYNSVVVYTNGSGRPATSNGIFACINTGSHCTNIRFIGNTVINGKADSPGAFGILDENGSGSYTWQNNLFYSNQSTAIGFNLGAGTTFTEDHNSWLNSGSPRNGTGDITVTSGAPNPFTDWTNSDYTLASNNADWEGGTTLSSPFNVDMAGAARPDINGVWNRGAFQFGDDPPPPPTTSANVSGAVSISGGVSLQ